LKILDKAASKLKNGKAKCESSCDNAVAWAFLFGNTVHICPAYWEWKDEAQSAALVHEGTHLGSGTNDIAYFWQNDESPHNVFGIGWDIIASTYDTWILTGFCIPGKDCQ
jgi:hypothetical protein